MIEDKYNIEYYDSKHCYSIDLLQKEYFLDNTSPILFIIDGKEVDEKSWGRLLERISNYLINKHSPEIKFLLNMQIDWSKQAVFMESSQIVAHLGPLVNGLYINTNHTSTHMCWLLQDILKAFNEDLDKCKLLIRKLPGNEDKEIQEYYFNHSRIHFLEFMGSIKRFDDNKLKNVIAGVDKLDILFRKHFPSYQSLFLFESKVEFSMMKSRFLTKTNLMELSEKNKESIRYILDLLTTYYQYVSKSNGFGYAQFRNEKI
jgi:hypothetical protein